MRGAMVPAAVFALLLALTAADDAGTQSPQTGIPGEELAGAGNCTATQFRCDDGSRCVPAAWRCDGRTHCADGSDELGCVWKQCGAGQFRCARSGLCIAAAWRCDGEPDCGPKDHSDEEPYMCEKDFKCAGNEARCASPAGGQFSCVPVRAFCDGRRDCADGSDEWDICENFTESSCAGLGCALGCRPTHAGLQCYCEPGSEPDGHRCVDTNECLSPWTCAQACRNVPGSHACSCREGHRLLSDQRSCLAVNDPPEAPATLVVVTQTGLLAGPVTSPHLPPDGVATVAALNVRAIDFHFDNQTVCYVHRNLSRSALVCADLRDLTRRTVLPAPALFPDLDSVSHLAIDWVSNNWYLSDEAREALYACDVTLQHCRLLLERGLNKLHGLALDPAAGLMFWSVWGAAAPGVFSARLDGGGAATLAALRLVYPSALALDRAARRVLWADSYLDCVEATDYDGGRRRTVYRGLLTDKVSHIAVLNEILYLPLWGEQAVLAVGTRPGGAAPTRTHVGTRPTAVLLVHRQAQPALSHPCARHKGGCAHMCVPDGARARCVCRHGQRLQGRGACAQESLDSYLLVCRGRPALVQALSLGTRDAEALAPATAALRPTAADVDVSGARLYYSDVHRYEIVSQSLDGLNREVFINTHIDNCEGMAIDWMSRNLYWTDEALGTVSVARLERAGVRRVLSRTPGAHPRGIALRPAAGMMYWSVWAGARGSASIQQARMDGSQARALVTSDLHWPNGLAALEAREELYWCDTFLNRIERLHLPSGKRTVLVAHADKPYSVALYEGAVIWSEHGTGAVRRRAADGTVTTLHDLPPPLYDVKLVSATMRVGENPCSYNNGNCSDLCLPLGTSRVCACADGASLRGGACVPGEGGAGGEPACPADQFHCGQGRCVDSQYVCDGDLDCVNGADEDAAPGAVCANLTCKEEGALKCDTNRCIPAGWICDGLQDCYDGADEPPACARAASCGAGQWRCRGSARCVPAAWRCDAQPDCGPGDASDEDDCPEVSQCGPELFPCADGTCAADPTRCDDAGGIYSEEYPHLHPMCEEHEFQCNNTECIRQEFRCDGRADCLDSSDERGCAAPPPASAAPPAPPVPPASPPAAAACAAPALSCDAGRCVPLQQQCDGEPDCEDGADEADRCGEGMAMCSPNPCSHTCSPSPRGPVCSCPAGLALRPGGLACGPARPCAAPAVCTQKCEELKNRYKCSCYEGYRLADDGHTCKSTSNFTAQLIFSNRHEIRALPLRESWDARDGRDGGGGTGPRDAGSRSLLGALSNTVALDWTLKGDQIVLFWTDVFEDKMYRGVLEGNSLSGIEVIISGGLQRAEGLAADWLAGNLYWVDGGLQQIEVSQQDGRWRRTLVSGDMSSPRALAVDPRFGYLFWSDWEESAPRIERCSLAGRDRKTVVQVNKVADGGDWPNGISLDYLAERLYWIDARSDSIHSTDYSGGAHAVELRAAAAAHPYALCVHAGVAYWSDWRANAVLRARLRGPARGAPRALVRTAAQPFDVKVVHPSRQPAGPAPCLHAACSHLCLTSAPGACACACPPLMRLQPDNTTCKEDQQVLLVATVGAVRALDISEEGGSEAGAGGVGGVTAALQGFPDEAPSEIVARPGEKQVYIALPQMNEVLVSSLQNGGTSRSLPLPAPAALALDARRSTLFAAAGGALYLTALDSGRTAVLLVGGMENVTTMTVDPQRGWLYFARSSPAWQLETCRCAGSERRTLRDDKEEPLLAGVASMCMDVERNRVYWVNLMSATIQYIDMNNEKITTVRLSAGARPGALALRGAALLYADASDAALRECAGAGCRVRARLEGALALSLYAASAPAPDATCARAGCAHVCVAGPACVCAAGYSPGPAGTCTPVDELVIYATSWELVARPTSGAAPAPRLLPPPATLAQPTALAYLAEGEWLYWIDGEAGGVRRARRDGSKEEKVADGEWLSGLCVDWLGGVVYWTAAPSLLLAARVDGSHAAVLQDTQPHGANVLAIDPIEGWLFLGFPSRLERARLDGSQRLVLYQGAAVGDVAVDLQNKRVYWAGGADAVFSSRYDGSDLRAHRVAHTGHTGQTGHTDQTGHTGHVAALAVHDDYLYWLDSMSDGGSVLSAPLSNLTQGKVLKDHAGDSLKDIMIWSSRAQSRGVPDDAAHPHPHPHPCAAHNGGCAQLCVPAGARAVCVCAHGRARGKLCLPYDTFLVFSRVTKIQSLHLDDDNNLNPPYPPIENSTLMRNAIGLAYWYSASLLFYSDIQRATINQVHFNGTGHMVLLKDVGAAEGVVFDPRTRTLYWTCNSVPALRAYRLPGADNRTDTNPEPGEDKVHTVVKLELGDRPRGIDIHICQRLIFWTNWRPSGPRIERALTSGLQRLTLVSTDILMPNALAVRQQPPWLYWADARLDKIERMALDGAQRQIVTRSSTEHPFALAVFQDTVIWTDWVARGVFRLDAGHVTTLQRDLPRPMDVLCVTPQHVGCADSDPCGVANGGCAELCTAREDGGVACACGEGKVLQPGGACRPVEGDCADDQFSCSEGGCIPSELVCDGVPHCSSETNASDEDLYYCTSRSCPAHMFWCGAGGRCVSVRRVCDGRNDCDDGSDEAACDCGLRQYRCDEGSCVDISARCDGVPQCADGSDERDCSVGPEDGPAGPTGPSDTSDIDVTTESLDEASLLCPDDKFTCGGNETAGVRARRPECIPLEWRCDGQVDCSDGSDETLHCAVSASCGPDSYRCLGGGCVPLRARCDGVRDCPRADDEAACVCAPGDLRCHSPPACLAASLYCDGDLDCADGSDEPPLCSPAPPASPPAAPAPHPLCAALPHAVYCRGRCVRAERVCDGVDDCEDGGGGGAGTDEAPELCSSWSTSFDTSGVGVPSVKSCGADWRCGPAACGAGREAGRGVAGAGRCAAGACVPHAALCDGNDDCGDYSDEWHCNVNECAVHNGGCQHNCTDLVVGRACWCRPGWSARGAACLERDECAARPCAGSCRNTVGSFECSCSEGYRLMADKVNCEPISSVRASLVLTNRYYIRQTPTGPGPATLLVHNLTNAVALDVHYSTGCLYWSDVTRLGSSIKRVCNVTSGGLGGAKGPPPLGAVPKHDHYQLLHSATLQNPDGLAVDWVAGNLYWCDKGTDTIEVSRLDGSHRKVVIRGDLTEPRALALHPAKGLLFWSDWGVAPHIGRASMAGSARRRLLTARLGWPNALTVCLAVQRLYFADAREDYIAVVDFDGSNLQILFSRESMPWLRLHHVFALAVWAGRVYWSDWETLAVESCRLSPDPHYRESNSSLSSGGALQCRTLLHTVHKPMDLRVLHPLRQPPMPELTAECERLNCSGLCLLDSAEGVAAPRCACPEHFTLTDGGACAPNCSASHFVCRDTLKCVPFWWRCDTQDDCGDGSDEPASCGAFRCAPGQLQCDGGATCVHPERLCDATPHCRDGRDERDCDTFTCLASQFKCPANATLGASARCISGALRCDGRRDCAGAEDERGCAPATCPPQHLQCGDGTCVPLVWVCDRDADCRDASDERPELCARRACPPGHFRCRSGRCVPRAWLCDAEADCPEREDEQDCETAAARACEPTYFRCGTGRCVPGRWRCDFEVDCGDGSDEVNCTPRNCSESEFRCDSGECIRGALRCSGAADCGDGSDEEGCGKPLCAPSAWWCDGIVDCASGADEAACGGAAGGAGAGAAGATGADGPGCRQAAAWRCDARPDCPSDELPAMCAALPTPAHMFRCSDDTNIPETLLCDGLADCSDGGDESAYTCSRRDSLCLSDETECEEGRCVPGNTTCSTEVSPCNWQTCSQICIPKHKHNYTCKCAAGYKHRVLPDGNSTCEDQGEKVRLIVAVGGELRVWEHRHLQNHTKTNLSEITALSGGYVDGAWHVWWASRGQLYRLLLSAQQQAGPVDTTNKSTVITSAGTIRGIAIDTVSRRVYWTTAVTPRASETDASDEVRASETHGTVSVATLDGGERVVLYDADEPDDLVIDEDNLELIWSQRGAVPGIFTAPLSGAGRPRRLVSRRVRRPGALALWRPARRLYFVDTYYDTLETVSLDGTGRAVVAVFSHRPAGVPRPPHLDETQSPPPLTAARACTRLAARDEWLHCAGPRALVRLRRRGRGARGGQGGDTRAADGLTAVAVLATDNNDTKDPCLSNPCDGGALCVRHATRGHVCLCTDELMNSNKCEQPFAAPAPPAASLPPPSPPSPPAGDACAGGCGPGECVEGACRCPPLFAGPQCRHYRCAAHCLHRGRCELDTSAAPPHGELHPLKCTCPRDYTGARCETPSPPATPPAAPAVPPDAPAPPRACPPCQNGGTCVLSRRPPVCACAPDYTGADCSACLVGPACAAGAVCRVTSRGSVCERRHDCRCEHGGTCYISSEGVVSCSCEAGWGGARCELADNRVEGGATLVPQPWSGSCAHSSCARGGRCVRTRAGSVCACAGAWGGPRCAHYVGHDHACARACRQPEICAWRTAANTSTDVGTPFCACPVDAHCGPQVGVTEGAGPPKWGGMLIAAVIVAVITLLIGWLVHKKRQSAFYHARLPDNVEINNPMYLAGEDETPRPNGGNHFANPVYESMYAPRQNDPTEEHDILLEDGSDSSPPAPERHALL